MQYVQSFFRPKGDVLEVRRRYNNLYIPSDFFYTSIRWVDAFPPDKPFTLNKPCSFHIMSKEIDAATDNNAILEPPDADYIFSAKVSDSIWVLYIFGFEFGCNLYFLIGNVDECTWNGRVLSKMLSDGRR